MGFTIKLNLRALRSKGTETAAKAVLPNVAWPLSAAYESAITSDEDSTNSSRAIPLLTPCLSAESERSSLKIHIPVGKLRRSQEARRIRRQEVVRNAIAKCRSNSMDTCRVCKRMLKKTSKVANKTGIFWTIQTKPEAKLLKYDERVTNAWNN